MVTTFGDIYQLPLDASASQDFGPFSKYSIRRRRRNVCFVTLGLFLLLSAIWYLHGPELYALGVHPYVFPKTQTSGPLIPHKIWQIMLPKKTSSVSRKDMKIAVRHSASWLALNPDYKYTMVGQEGSNQFIQPYKTQPKAFQTYNSLPNVGMKSDLLRYIILDAEGGIYTDTDTVALKPFDEWVPAKWKPSVRLIVGIEFDQRDGKLWPDILHPVQFGQWTIVAGAGHPVFAEMVRRALIAVDDLAAKYKLPVGELEPDSIEVMNSTGPAVFTDVVFEHMQKFDTSLRSTRDLSYMTEPALYGDVLVLPIDGFGMGQPHSHSTNDGTTPDIAVVKHLFKGTWRY